MLYLTFNDIPSGVYYSQVTDVCRYLQSEFRSPIKLVALISIRKYFHNRKKIKKEFPNSIVIPMFPKHRNWRINIIQLSILTLFIKKRIVIARGPFATHLALQLRNLRQIKKVCFDGRGAYSAELNEYNVVDDDFTKKGIENIERTAVLQCDFRIAVSNQLVNYWKERFDYKGNEYAVIPCTLNSKLFTSEINFNEIKKTREKLNVIKDDILLVYSGSGAEWQSFNLVDDILCKILSENKNCKIVFMSQEVLEKYIFFQHYREQIIQLWLAPNEVSKVLLACDYGLVIREISITNKVASPVKFAEYLACGLKILISDNIGDYSEFVIKNNCGIVINSLNENYKLSAVEVNEKKLIHILAMEYFQKQSYKESYIKIMEL